MAMSSSAVLQMLQVWKSEWMLQVPKSKQVMFLRKFKMVR